MHRLDLRSDLFDVLLRLALGGSTHFDRHFIYRLDFLSIFCVLGLHGRLVLLMERIDLYLMRRFERLDFDAMRLDHLGVLGFLIRNNRLGSL